MSAPRPIPGRRQPAEHNYAKETSTNAIDTFPSQRINGGTIMAFLLFRLTVNADANLFIVKASSADKRCRHSVCQAFLKKTEIDDESPCSDRTRDNRSWHAGFELTTILSRRAHAFWDT